MPPSTSLAASSAASTTSIMGMDDTPQEIVEGTALLDSEHTARAGDLYGTVTPPRQGQFFE